MCFISKVVTYSEPTKYGFLIKNTQWIIWHVETLSVKGLLNQDYNLFLCYA